MVIVMLVSLLAASASAGLALVSHTERQVASRHRQAAGQAYGAESALARALAALEAQPTWNDVPGSWTMGVVVVSSDVEQRTEALNRSLAGRLPAGDDTPRWRCVATGREGGMETVTWVRDDPADGDANPGADVNGQITLRAEAVAPGGHRRGFEATVRREDNRVTLVAWREVW